MRESFIILVNGYRKGQEAWPYHVAMEKRTEIIDSGLFEPDTVVVESLIDYLQTHEERTR